ncbi:phosphoribosylaminoimidazolesuccinocarboxamide synthase [Tichowtungia aerotolerans]|uniref:Phosphoribosylaminoimidazole-succinocarboxamide synthase n=1 Tax=Tichowtungia aerotolerans TaxID=2697043 RepID=A0A6P1MFZ9_9BACT|nr:phosphoribosylaminoimidazolesuccinocarboxamide synthase [Tichowtungia aerotolerans]QHI70536.1 phosphoribosylaminoimidazolesuccinocarboxamide synthase [Tichowtungia aerotolerans]
MSEALTRIEIPNTESRSGKVREIFDAGDKLLFVASDRISAFDCVMPNGIPEKGAVLNMISKFWFERTGDVVKNHMLSTDVSEYPAPFSQYADQLKGRSMLVKKTEVLPVECIVRGYLIGSGWKEYQKSETIGGMPLRSGYKMADKLDEPIFTPSTKAEQGLHDENISFDKMKEIVGEEKAEKLKEISLKLYKEAADYALTKGIIIADTKFEFGELDGEIILIDEALTPDSSRFWPADSYEVGSSPMSYDKQFVRDYLETLEWDKTPPAPALPEEIIEKSRAKYLEAYERLTGTKLEI